MNADHSNEDQRIADNRALRSPIVYEIVRSEGDEELARPTSSLWWSGIAAGLAMSISVIGRGALHHYFDDWSWSPVVESFGYTLGFVIVVAGRLQLFTENTITAVLPLLTERTVAQLRRVARLWLVVLLANFVGTLLAAILITEVGIVPSVLLPDILQVSHHFADKSALQALTHGIPAGLLIAALVWMLPSVQGEQVMTTVMITYFIALTGSSHVIAGSVEAFLLLLTGQITAFHALFGLLAPTFVGNVLGGTGLFALLSYAQVREEMG